ncbi:MAG: DUF2017 family protein [Dermatophilaceae bacterium]
MARGFRRKGHGDGIRYVATLDPMERATVAGLMEQVHDLLEVPEPTIVPVGVDGDEFDAIVAGLSLGVSGAAADQSPLARDQDPPADGHDPPASGAVRDPALDRLLPLANREDDEAASEFRRLTERGLRTRKAGALADATAALRGGDDHLRLDRRRALAFLTALTDVRLVLGERMGLRSDDDAELLARAAGSLDEDDPLTHALAVYDFLTWLQETLASAMLEA